ncbi:MAG: hypothetical protein OXH94_08340 [Rhodospirillales bacterium]|nr:hypothetical protein [Rhodospirillales bacterium]
MNPADPNHINPPDSRNPGLTTMLSYPLIQAIAERRTRRVARGCSVVAGPLSHNSENEPSPLGLLEEAVLICSTGLTGPVMHDGPLKKPSGEPEDLGSMFWNLTGRAGPSADNCQATSLFMINDEGIWLLKRLRGKEGMDVLDSLPRSWSDWSEDDWLRAAATVKVKVHDDRMSFPREFPYYIGWNKQFSNVPGTTIFLPVVDCTRQYINILLIVLSEPEGQRPLIVDDWQRFRPRSWKDIKAWVGQHIGLGPKIPYQPIGGIDRAMDGFVNPDIVVPLGAGYALRTDYEIYFLLQNLMLLGQAMGIGVWGHGSIWPAHVFQRDPEKKWFGLGFRHELPKSDAPWAPIPASQHNPVGLDGILEGLCPPYVSSMDEAVDIVLEEKYGPNGIFTDQDQFSRPYQHAKDAETYLRFQNRHSPEAIQYTKDVCNYIHETYGRFPAHIDAFYTPGFWVQTHHLELEYYERFFDPYLWRNQAAHATWHDGD